MRYISAYSTTEGTSHLTNKIGWGLDVINPKQILLRRDKKHKDGVEVPITRDSPTQNHEELLNMLKGQFG